jgi:hypothetical protein
MMAAGAVAGCMFGHTVMGLMAVDPHMSFIVDPIREFLGFGGAEAGVDLAGGCADGCGLDHIADAMPG